MLVFTFSCIDILLLGAVGVVVVVVVVVQVVVAVGVVGCSTMKKY